MRSQAFAVANVTRLGPSAAGVNLASIGIHSISPSGVAVPFAPSPTRAFAAPRWQFAPFALNSTSSGGVPVLLFDSASDPLRLWAIDCALSTRNACITPLTSFLLPADSGTSGGDAVGTASSACRVFLFPPLIVCYVCADMRFSPVIFAPVVSTDGSVTAVAGVGISWVKALQAVLPTLAGIVVDVVVSAAGGSTLTVRLDGVAGSNFSSFPGDTHEEAYDSMAFATTASLGAVFTLTVYPTSDMEAYFQTSAPARLATASVVSSRALHPDPSFVRLLPF